MSRYYTVNENLSFHFDKIPKSCSVKDKRTIRYTGVWSLFLGDGLGYWSKILHGPKYLSGGPHEPPDRFNFTEKKLVKIQF